MLVRALESDPIVCYLAKGGEWKPIICFADDGALRMHSHRTPKNLSFCLAGMRSILLFVPVLLLTMFLRLVGVAHINTFYCNYLDVCRDRPTPKTIIRLLLSYGNAARVSALQYHKSCQPF